MTATFLGSICAYPTCMAYDLPKGDAVAAPGAWGI
jgi:hypothetical protein